MTNDERDISIQRKCKREEMEVYEEEAMRFETLYLYLCIVIFLFWILYYLKNIIEMGRKYTYFGYLICFSWYITI